MDKPFDLSFINPLEKPIVTDFNLLGSQIYQSLRTLAERQYLRRTSSTNSVGLIVSGFVNDGFQVVPTSPVSGSVQITAGLGFQSNPQNVKSAIESMVGQPVEGLNDRSSYQPLVLSAAEAIPLTAAPAVGQSRIDIIEVKADRYVTDLSSRQVFDNAVRDFRPNLVSKTLSFALDGRRGAVASPAESTTGIGYKTGVAAVTGAEVAPATSSGYVKIAEILVVGGAVSYDFDVIKDTRALLAPSGLHRAVVHFSMPTGGAVLKPTLISLEAPPSVEVGLVGQNVVGGQVIAFLKAGNTLRTYAPNVKAYVATLLDTKKMVTDVSSPSAVVMGSANAAALVGANAAQAIKVALGQPHAVCQFSTSFVENGGVVGVSGLPNPLFYTLVWDFAH